MSPSSTVIATRITRSIREVGIITFIKGDDDESVLMESLGSDDLCHVPGEPGVAVGEGSIAFVHIVIEVRRNPDIIGHCICAQFLKELCLIVWQDMRLASWQIGHNIGVVYKGVVVDGIGNLPNSPTGGGHGFKVGDPCSARLVDLIGQILRALLAVRSDRAAIIGDAKRRASRHHKIVGEAGMCDSIELGCQAVLLDQLVEIGRLRAAKDMARAGILQDDLKDMRKVWDRLGGWGAGWRLGDGSAGRAGRLPYGWLLLGESGAALAGVCSGFYQKHLSDCCAGHDKDDQNGQPADGLVTLGRNEVSLKQAPESKSRASESTHTYYLHLQSTLVERVA